MKKVDAPKLDLINNNNIVHELYKLCIMELPINITQSIDEIHDQIYFNESIEKSHSFQTLKKELKKLYQLAYVF